MDFFVNYYVPYFNLIAFVISNGLLMEIISILQIR
jgi:hypothetical protein